MTLSTDYETNAFGEHYIPAINGDLFAGTPSHQLYEKHLGSEFWREDHCHLVIGSDSGLLINHVAQRGVPEGSLYLFIEPRELVSVIAARTDAALCASDAIQLCEPGQWQALASTRGLDTYILKKRILVHQCLAARTTLQADYHPLVSDVISTLDNTAYTTKLCLVDKPLIEQVLRNLSENLLPVMQLQGQFAGRTALVMGAGPSLNDHLEWIREHREQLVIFAASRLGKKLLEIDLLPDVVVSIDHQPVNFELSRDCLKFSDKVVLLNANNVSPALLSQWQGPSIYSGELLPWHSPLNTANLEAECGPTVTNTAVVAAGAMGFTTILLSGVDFCSPVGGKTHAVGEDLNEQLRRTHRVTTFSGESANSNVQMMYAAETLARQVARIPSTRVINLAPLACRIEGVDHLPPDQLALDSLPSPAGGLVVAEPSSQDRINHNQRLLAELEAVHQQLKTIARLCDDAIDFNRKIYKRDKQGNYNLKAKQKLDNLQARLDTEFDHINVTIKKAGMVFFIDTMTTRDINQFSDEQLEQQGRRYYRAYKKSAHSLLAMVGQAIERVQSRLLEDQFDGNPKVLFERWQNDLQPGRASLWQRHHPQYSAALTGSDTEQFAALQTQFAESLQPQRPHGPLPDRYWYLRKRLLAYFHSGNRQQLQAVIDNLTQRDGAKPRGEQLLALGRGCMALLQGSRSTALQELKQAAHNDLDEPLLQLLVKLAIQENDLGWAESLLAEAANKDDHHLPQYANLLKNNKKAAEAADAYTTWLQCHPDDLETWLQLAELYVEAGEPELAQAVYGYVLEQDPGNLSAAAFMNSG